jgi:hypothetical protein
MYRCTNTILAARAMAFDCADYDYHLHCLFRENIRANYNLIVSIAQLPKEGDAGSPQLGPSYRRKERKKKHQLVPWALVRV